MYVFSLDSTMKEVETKFPFARAVLHAKFHVGGCASCGYEPHESVSQVASKHGKNATEMLDALNAGVLDMSAAEISSDAVSKMLNDESVLFVDVRETWEFELCKLSNRAVLLNEKTMPLVFEQGLHAKAVVVYCHHGVRSLNAALYMRQNGLPNAVSLKGGIDRYAQSVDSSIPRY